MMSESESYWTATYLPKRLELSLRMVLALPKASRTGDASRSRTSTETASADASPANDWRENDWPDAASATEALRRFSAACGGAEREGRRASGRGRT